MHPVLIHFNFPQWLPLLGGLPVNIYTYGVLVATGFLSGIWLITWRASKEGIDPDKMLDLCFWFLITSILGARLLYVIVDYKSFLNRPMDLFAIWKGGLVFYGGFIAGLLTIYYYARRYHLSFLKLIDIIVPSLALGQALGRLGCFAAGCCYGKATNVPWAVIFKHPAGLAPRYVQIHPTQLYESGALFLVFIFLSWFFKRRKFDGQISAYYLLIYAVIRSVIEIFRGDTIRGFLIPGWISTSQAISMVMFGIGVWFLIKRNRSTKLES